MSMRRWLTHLCHSSRLELKACKRAFSSSLFPDKPSPNPRHRSCSMGFLSLSLPSPKKSVTKKKRRKSNKNSHVQKIRCQLSIYHPTREWKLDLDVHGGRQKQRAMRSSKAEQEGGSNDDEGSGSCCQRSGTCELASVNGIRLIEIPDRRQRAAWGPEFLRNIDRSGCETRLALTERGGRAQKG
jgi:hypothetical protein